MYTLSGKDDHIDHATLATTRTDEARIPERHRAQQGSSRSNKDPKSRTGAYKKHSEK
ncbi:MAG: hypothetical protein ACOH13_10860 [Flavobacteriales bacterium]